MADGEEIIVIKAEDRALEQRGERQIVLGQQQAIAERHQIHHRELLGQLHPVGAGDRNAGIFQRPHHGRGEGRALAHQDEDVGRADRPTLRSERLALIEPVADLAGDPVGERDGGRRAARAFGETAPRPGRRRAARA